MARNEQYQTDIIVLTIINGTGLLTPSYLNRTHNETGINWFALYRGEDG
jgi:hypothetical protein